MKKRYFAAAAVLAAVLSCSKEQPVTNPAEEVSQAITIQASIADLNTKVGFTPSYDATYGKPQSMALTWADEDKLRVYNHADRSQYSDFTLSAGIGNKNGTFTGTPVTATSYDVEIINGDVNYAAQTQPSDGVTTDLKCLASVSGIASLGTIVFDSFSSVLAITAQMPSTDVAAKVKSVDITASEAIFNGGKSLSVTFGSTGDADADGILHFFATLPQGDQAIAAGTTLLVKFNAPGESHDVYTRFIELPAGKFTNNKLNTININASQSDKHAGATTCDGSSAEKAYLIGDKYQMGAISGLLEKENKKFFKFIDNISVSSWSSIDCTNGKIDMDGSNKEISGLTAPLFSFFDGKASNLSITNATISSTNNYYGVFARTVDTSMECELSNISVSNSSVSANGSVGGMIGRISATSSCILTNCSADVATTGTGYYTGGLIGQVDNATFTYCSARGAVSSTTHYAGGLVGAINGTVGISKSYATGSVNTNTKNRAGGLIGNINAAAKGTVTDCYSSGAVSGNAYSGGFIGGVENGASFTVTRGYTNSTVAGAKWTCCVFCGTGSQYGTTTGFVGWNTSNRAAWCYNETAVTTGNYMGKEGTISAHAITFGWDTNIWDLSGDIPVLK